MKDLKISKELIRNVLEKETENLPDDFTFDIIDNYIIFADDGACMFEVNIYEFAYKCKDWALTKGYMMKIENHYSNSIVVQIKKTISNSAYVEPWKKTFKSEIEAIIKACNWILENSK